MLNCKFSFFNRSLLSETLPELRMEISFVEVNPYLKFGIRAHYKDLTAAHCLHSMFDIFHRDFLLMWIYFLPGLFMLWEYISLQLNISHLFKGTQNFSLVH